MIPVLNDILGGDVRMIWGAIKEKERIFKIIQSLVVDEVGITVKVPGMTEIFSSRVLGIHIGGKTGAGDDGEPELIIEKLVPGRGNRLICSSREVTVLFFFDKNFYRFKSRCRGISNTYPTYGFLLSLPRAMQFRERRSEQRRVFESPGLVCAEFTLALPGSRQKSFSLTVHNYSKHGIGLLVQEEDFDLVDVLHVGDHLFPISLYASEAIITNVSGRVRHVTKIENGPYRGYYIIGIESEDIIPINETIDAVL